jgi:hypothetical protein
MAAASCSTFPNGSDATSFASVTGSAPADNCWYVLIIKALMS